MIDDEDPSIYPASFRFAPTETFMKRYAFILAISITALLISASVTAGSSSQCPDISQAQKIGDCPTEDDMKRMFKIHCGFERDPNAKKKTELCDSYGEYKRRKNNALWESSDKEFMGYVSCAVPPAEIKKGQPTSIAISQKNGLYKITCSYQSGAKLSMRTRSVCRVPGVKNSLMVMRAECGANGKPCKFECD
ncbi:MAG: hypothetical protein DBP01_00185 [gamma proteobacterium symbiont of Ctena orbiculata]|nr:MAG: hypothetical protein DBP01_00185 [gamma proteobacterium symbiont of Ctena orbiculata]